MSEHTDNLRDAYQQAEARALELQAEKDAALQEIRDRFFHRQREANLEAAQRQKKWRDAEAVEALLDRPDGEEMAHRLAAQGGLSREAVEFAFPSGGK